MNAPFHKIPALLGLLAGVLLGVAALPAQMATNQQAQTSKKSFIYTLTPTDKIRVSVFQEDDLSTIVRIDARGNANLPLVGNVHVAGLSVSDAQHAIEKAYQDQRFLRSPQVTISIEEYAPREVSISGQIKSPGRYLLPVESTMSIVDLVTQAGGFTDIAKGTAVTITRTAPDGTKQVIVVDVQSLIQGKDQGKKDASLLLQPGDIIYVPERII